MHKKVRVTMFIIISILLVALTVYLFPLMTSIFNEESRLELQATINGFGFLGWLMMLGIQVLQVVVAILPGEPVEIVMGIMYGPYLGTLTCFLGIFIGTLIIFGLTKVIGKPFIQLFINPDELANYKFINTKEKKDAIVFTLFFIPGTPKDVLTYFAPYIDMNIFRFIAISLFARIPSVVSSTIGGTSLIEGNWLLSIIIFSSTFLIAIIGFFINRIYLKKHNTE